MMKKSVVNKTGEPEVLELVYSESPSISTGQIPVDLKAAGVNYIDAYQRTGNVAKLKAKGNSKSSKSKEYCDEFQE